MDYFEALKASERVADPQFHAHSPVPPPRPNNVGDLIAYIRSTCDDLYFSSESDEPVELYQLSASGLQSMEADLDKLTLPSAHDFAVFITGERSLSDDGFVCEKHPIDVFFRQLRNHQVSERQKKLAEALEETFRKEVGEPGCSGAYYRVGIPPNIEVYVVMLIDGQVVGLKTLSIET
ncbi:hypothetical protein FBU59_003978 [Linderina macrospora]|uniref:Uncharacterized protein n=1 Tax=Linderina macrospora TaxID=4868 RepID=A0ACC1J6R9_9FUNG|nr:hypothetical protein FBU59_003978 [Linderina macrospora]